MLVKEKKKYEQILRSGLEEVTISMIYFINEYVFHDYLTNLISYKRSSEKDTVKFIRKSFAFEKGVQVHYDLIRSFFGSDQIKVDQLTFELGAASKNVTIHLALFSNRDYFSESLKAILESNSDYINEFYYSKIITNTKEDFNNNGKEILGEIYFSQLLINASKLDDLKNSYVHNQITPTNFLNSANIELEKTLKDFLEILGLDDEPTKSKEEITSRKHKQIFICKIGYISILFEYLKILDKPYFETYYSNEKREVFLKILQIFKIISENNAFLSCVFFNNWIPEYMFTYYEYYNSSVHFYYNLLINLKNENYKTNWFFISKICIILKNEIIGELNEDILKIMFAFVKEYFKILDNKSFEYTCSILSLRLDEIMKSSFFTENLIKYLALEDSVSKLVIKEIIKLVYKLSNYYFNYIIDSNRNLVVNVEKILENYEKLDSKDYFIFFKFFSRCNCEEPFVIYSLYNKKIFEDILTKIDANLVGRNDITNMQGKITEDSIQIDQNLLGLKTILFVLKKFKVIFLNYKDRGFFDNFETKAYKLDFYLKYFIELCLFPTIFSIYKIVYFSEHLNSELKYLIYVLIIYFLESLNFLCKELIRELSDNQISYNNEEIKNIVNNKLKINNIQTVNIIQLFVTIGNSAEMDIQKINSPNFNKLDYQKIIQIFGFHISLFKDLETINNNDIGRFVMFKDALRMKFEEDSFRLAIKKIYLEYSESKKDFSNRAVAEILNSKENHIYESVKKNLAIEFLTHYGEIDQFSEILGTDNCLFPRHHAVYLEILLKLFKNSPSLFQVIIMQNSIMQTKIFKMLGFQVAFLYQNLVVEFLSLSKKQNLYAYKNLINLIEFGRLLAENHNQMFQTFLISFRHYDKENNYSLTFFQMILKISMFIVKLIKHHNSKKSQIKFVKEESYLSYIYFNMLISCVHEFLIEIVQGTLSSNFEIISKDPIFISYVKVTRDLLICQDIDEYVFYLGHSFSFLNTYMEDINNHSDKPIKYFKAERLFSCLLKNFRVLVYIAKHNSSKLSKYMKSNNIYDFYNLRFSSITEEVKNFKLLDDDHKILNNLFILGILDEYNPYFNSAYQIFRMFKLADIQDKLCSDGSFKRYLKHMSSVTLNPKGNSDSMDILIRETYLFFNELVKTVEILTRRKNEISESDIIIFKKYFDSDSYMKKIYKNASKEILNSNIEINLVKIIFISKPKFRFLSNKDSCDFINSTIKNEPTIRKYLMLRHVEEKLTSLIDFRKELSMQKSKFINYVYNINYYDHIRVSVLISLLTNIMLVFSMKYDRMDLQKLPDSPSLSAHDVKYSYPSVQNYIFYLNTVHLAYIGPLICSFISFKFYEDFYLTKSYNIMSVGRTIFSIINNQSFTLVWNFICGSLAFISEPFLFFYALQLFSMISIFQIMKAAVSSIFLRYGQFISTALLLIIVCIFYGSICIFFLHSGMTDAENKSYCETFWQCVLHIVNCGIRSGSLGFPVKTISTTGYWQEFLVDWTFYLIVILILLNFVNGIIVDTFNELYEANLVKVDTLENTCIICDQNRSKFVYYGVDFDNHVFSDHYLLNYFYYIIRIKSENKYDLNNLDSQVLESITACNTDFIPVKNSWDMMQVRGYEDGNEKNQKVYCDENKLESDKDDDESEDYEFKKLRNENKEENVDMIKFKDIQNDEVVGNNDEQKILVNEM